MKAGTLVKLGSLALDVFQDQKVQELATMIHKGAKRRGLLAQQLPDQGAITKVQAPPAAKPAPAKVPFAPSPPSAPSVQGPNVQNWLTADNAKKALTWAGMIKDVLMK